MLYFFFLSSALHYFNLKHSLVLHSLIRTLLVLFVVSTLLSQLKSFYLMCIHLLLLLLQIMLLSFTWVYSAVSSPMMSLLILHNNVSFSNACPCISPFYLLILSSISYANLSNVFSNNQVLFLILFISILRTFTSRL